jgi:hypothetical protein
MMRRTYWIGTAALGLALMVASPKFGALTASARQVEQCFRGIAGTSGALSPIERLVFGLVAAKTDGTGRR